MTEKHKGIYILYACGGLEILTLNPKNKVLPCHIYDILTWGKKEMCSALSRCLSLCFVGPPSETSVASEVSPISNGPRTLHGGRNGTNPRTGDGEEGGSGSRHDRHQPDRTDRGVVAPRAAQVGPTRRYEYTILLWLGTPSQDREPRVAA